MLIPRFWSKSEGKARTPGGYWMTFALWRGSATSSADAETLAREAVARMAARIESGEGFPQRYSYPGRQLREEIVRDAIGKLPSGSSQVRREHQRPTTALRGIEFRNEARSERARRIR